MSLNATLKFTKDLLNDLESPYVGSVTAYIQPPQIGDYSQPEIHIWPIRINGKRVAMSQGKISGNLKPIPLSGGQRQNSYTLAIYVRVALDTQGNNADAAFPAFIDLLFQQIWTVRLSTVLTDPDTGAVSSLVNWGEDYDIEFAPAHFLNDQGLVLASALITMNVREWFQG